MTLRSSKVATTRGKVNMYDGVLSKYAQFLPVNQATPMITLGEGNTPLVKSSRLGKEMGCEELYFKLEGCNPTGSFKDRGMVLAVAKGNPSNVVGLEDLARPGLDVGVCDPELSALGDLTRQLLMARNLYDRVLLNVKDAPATAAVQLSPTATTAVLLCFISLSQIR